MKYDSLKYMLMAGVVGFSLYGDCYGLDRPRDRRASRSSTYQNPIESFIRYPFDIMTNINKSALDALEEVIIPKKKNIENKTDYYDNEGVDHDKPDVKRDSEYKTPEQKEEEGKKRRKFVNGVLDTIMNNYNVIPKDAAKTIKDYRNGADKKKEEEKKKIEEATPVNEEEEQVPQERRFFRRR